ncbi:uncharacterized protein LOC101072313 [Tachysurus ichikawai]
MRKAGQEDCYCIFKEDVQTSQNARKSHPRALKISRRKVIRKEMTTRSKEDSRRERSNNFQAFVILTLETLLGSCSRKYKGPREWYEKELEVLIGETQYE